MTLSYSAYSVVNDACLRFVHWSFFCEDRRDSSFGMTCD